ncbi:hypothetical protein Rleg2_4151 [Rhizobium leguminosarum bv. trifolii WSM2304]|uniref:Uncharacterized protein n=1 Tax=Rhizobium leguminosarum bv. trifolii (strain WSM2304) TaxID=395492 RepID=A0ABF7QT33_RHILW|nr:hypothetical protein [Rhizobium leguminosarum]ACI57413.1 hypothetical protein Rleg2_4151 [Rhizobium leguminosarum bv. trifolii WSM2304]
MTSATLPISVDYNRAFDRPQTYLDASSTAKRTVAVGARFAGAIFAAGTIVTQIPTLRAENYLQAATVVVSPVTAPAIDEKLLSDEFAASVARINELAAEPDGWKGPGSIRMSDGVKSGAVDFLTWFFGNEQRMSPFIGLDGDGEIAMFWKHGSIIMDLTINDRGTYSYYAEIVGVPYSGEDIPVATPLPPEVLNALLI